MGQRTPTVSVASAKHAKNITLHVYTHPHHTVRALSLHKHTSRRHSAAVCTGLLMSHFSRYLTY